MKIRARDLAVVIVFLGILYAVFFLNLLKPADELSYSERRKLAQFPELNAETILSAEAMEGFDDYAVDQIAFREQWRRLKARFDLNVWLKTDNNAIFVEGGQVFKTEYPIRENSVTRLCGILNYVNRRYLAGLNVRYALVPDKNYYLPDKSGHLVLDYQAMSGLIRDNMDAEIKEISLFDALTADSYYLTDAHWKQETLAPVVNAVAEGFGSALRFDGNAYTEKTYAPFYGVYYGQSALDVEPDTLTYLVSGTTENAVVTSIEKPGEVLPVYDESQLGGMDSYNIFLLGPQAVVRVENPGSPGGKELIIFRDSYAGSLAPLLLDGYAAVTLIDLRYIRADLVGDYADFSGDPDVLFLYSATLFNTSDSVQSPPQEEFVSPFLARSER
ncbi:MAG: hypothetical protein LBR76_03860 [Oscillospiraceae bacterium]|jgi:hypothetical protein|nr:hypothetical protein [Oscillospiraceae bacterium]